MWNRMDDDPLINLDSLNETVDSSGPTALISTTYGAPQQAVVHSALDFVRGKLFAMRQLLPSVESVQLRCVKVNFQIGEN